MPTIYKIVLVGDAESGKSTLIINSVSNTFRKNYNLTIEDSFNKTFNDGTFNITDTSGDKQYRDLLPQHCLNRDAIILCIDLSDAFFEKKTKDQSDQEYITAYLQRWLTEIKKSAPSAASIQIIGTKTDAINKLLFDQRINAFRQACSEIMTTNGQIHAYHITSAKAFDGYYNKRLDVTSDKGQLFESPLTGVFEQVIAEDPFEKFKALSISKGNLETILKTYQDKRNWRFSFFSLCTYGSESIKRLNIRCENLAENSNVTGADILALLSSHRVESLKNFASSTFPAPKSGTEKIIRELYTQMTTQAAVVNARSIVKTV